MTDYKAIRKDLYERFHDAFEKLYVSELKDQIADKDDVITAQSHIITEQDARIAQLETALYDAPPFTKEELRTLHAHYDEMVTEQGTRIVQLEEALREWACGSPGCVNGCIRAATMPDRACRARAALGKDRT